MVSDIFPHPVLIADIGGTNCRVAIVDQVGAPVRLLARLDSATLADLPLAFSRLMAGGKPARSAVVAVAGPVVGTSARLTNVGAAIDCGELADALRLDRVLLLNDFQSLAVSLSVLTGDDLVSIQAGLTKAGPRLVLGPGTGFGAATLAPVAEQYAILSSEAGHIGLGPISAAQKAFWPLLETADGRVTVETAAKP